MGKHDKIYVFLNYKEKVSVSEKIILAPIPILKLNLGFGSQYRNLVLVIQYYILLLMRPRKQTNKKFQFNLKNQRGRNNTHSSKIKMNGKKLSRCQFHFPGLLVSSPTSKQETKQKPWEVELALAQFFAIHFHFWTMWICTSLTALNYCSTQILSSNAVVWNSMTMDILFQGTSCFQTKCTWWPSSW